MVYEQGEVIGKLCVCVCFECLCVCVCCVYVCLCVRAVCACVCCVYVCWCVRAVCVCVCVCVLCICASVYLQYFIKIVHGTLYLIVDSIEANVEQGAHRVVEGNTQLVKAIKHQVQS